MLVKRKVTNFFGSLKKNRDRKEGYGEDKRRGNKRGEKKEGEWGRMLKPSEG